MPTFERARPADAARLAEASKLALDYDVHYGAPGPGGPPGYDSAAWQSRAIRSGEYYKILAGDRIIGGIIVLRKGVRAYEVGPIFIEPEFQDQGIGTEAFEFLWSVYPLARRWILGTPSWNERTQHFFLFDLLVLDILIFCTWTPHFLVIPGTEGMAGYKDWRMHVRAHMTTGLLVLVVAAALLALVPAFLY